MSIIRRAKEILSIIEKTVPDVNVAKNKKEKEEELECVSIEDYSNDAVIRELRQLDINTLTPIEAMNFIYEIKKMLI